MGYGARVDIIDRLLRAAASESDPGLAGELHSAITRVDSAVGDGPEHLEFVYDPEDASSLKLTAEALTNWGECLRLLGEHVQRRAR